VANDKVYVQINSSALGLDVAIWYPFHGKMHREVGGNKLITNGHVLGQVAAVSGLCMDAQTKMIFDWALISLKVAS
jgi:hypothetical protein